MAELRPFPPSPRRRALARQSGLHGASAILVGGVACGVLLIVLAMLGEAAAARLAAWIAAAARQAPTLQPRDAITAVLELAAPLACAAAIVALLAHLAQTRALWLPRRRLAGAPVIDPARGRHAMFDLVAAAVIGFTTFGWLWFAAARLGSPRALLGAAATLAIAWVALGIFDALLRTRDLANALQMTAREQREDARLAGADPRWRSARARAADDPGSAIAGATLLVLGDGIAVAVAWDPVRRPRPLRTASGHDARATQLLALARRRALPIHRDPVLARALDGTGPVDEAHWPRLAEIVGAMYSSKIP